MIRGRLFPPFRRAENGWFWGGGVVGGCERKERREERGEVRR